MRLNQVAFARSRFYEAKDDVHAQAFRSRQSLARVQNVSFAERLASGEVGDGITASSGAGRLGGSREVSFVPNGAAVETEKGTRKKRGVESLGLRHDKSERKGRPGKGFARVELRYDQ